MISKMINCKSQLSNIQIYKSKMVNINSSFRALTGLANEILTEDTILALAGQFKQLSHEPEKLR